MSIDIRDPEAPYHSPKPWGGVLVAYAVAFCYKKFNKNKIPSEIITKVFYKSDYEHETNYGGGRTRTYIALRTDLQSAPSPIRAHLQGAF